MSSPALDVIVQRCGLASCPDGQDSLGPGMMPYRRRCTILKRMARTIAGTSMRGRDGREPPVVLSVVKPDPISTSRGDGRRLRSSATNIDQTAVWVGFVIHRNTGPTKKSDLVAAVDCSDQPFTRPVSTRNFDYSETIVSLRSANRTGSPPASSASRLHGPPAVISMPRQSSENADDLHVFGETRGAESVLMPPPPGSGSTGERRDSGENGKDEAPPTPLYMSPSWVSADGEVPAFSPTGR